MCTHSEHACITDIASTGENRRRVPRQKALDFLDCKFSVGVSEGLILLVHVAAGELSCFGHLCISNSIVYTVTIIMRIAWEGGMVCRRILDTGKVISAILEKHMG